MPVCLFHWRCNRNQWQDEKKRENTIQLILEVLSKHGNGTVRCNIRQGVHPGTYGPGRVLAPDPLGDHITAEFLDPTDNKWHHFHLYVVKENDEWIVNPNVNPNPTYAKWSPFVKEQSNPRSVDARTGKARDREETEYYTPVQDIPEPVEQNAQK